MDNILEFSCEQEKVIAIIEFSGIQINNPQKANTFCKNTCLILNDFIISDSFSEEDTKLYYIHPCGGKSIFVNADRYENDETSRPKFYCKNSKWYF